LTQTGWSIVTGPSPQLPPPRALIRDDNQLMVVGLYHAARTIKREVAGGHVCKRFTVT
jgi:hypothetical protein